MTTLQHLATGVDAAVEDSVAWLSTPAAADALAADPYWPKWDGPWWRMELLHELGLAHRIPRTVVERLVDALASHYVPTLPITAADVPPGKDLKRHFPCHCQLGTVYQVLTACGVDVAARLPWVLPWFLRWQLPDGGYNCDESAYARKVGHSSVVSTLPVLEALLYGTQRPLTPAEVACVDAGAEYLMKRRVWRSLSKGGQVMCPAWRQPAFPRFYHFDLLRGLLWLVRWARARGRTLPREAVAEAYALCAQQASPTGALPNGPRTNLEVTSLRRDPSGTWLANQPAASFPLLDLVSAPGVESPWLSAQWREVEAALGGRQRITSHSPYESTIGFSRALRVGSRVLVSGTAPIWPDGSCPPDAEAQAARCLEIISAALAEAGARLEQVVRTRMYLTNAADAEAVGRAHGAVFGAIRPAATMVVVSALLDPRWKVEVEAEAMLDATGGGPA